MNKPNTKPNNPNFSSGPTSKRPGWDISVLSNALTGRSHRSVECKERLKEAIDKSKDILKLPDDYLLGIMPGSNTGALEAAMWCLLGKTGVDILAWENFGKDWVIDAISELKLDNLNIHEEDYGKLPDLSKVNFDNDVIFTWNGTTSGVKVPNGDWIPDDRKGLTICDATSAIFGMPIDYNKCDVITWSWQKILGGEAAHGMIAISPRVVERLESFTPSWPVPKLFRLAENKKLIKGIFEGNTINTPSMICVEDIIDSLNWVSSQGGLDSLISKSQNSLQKIREWINERDWVSFLSEIKDDNYISNTGITFKIIEDWFTNKDESGQRAVMADICKLLSENNVGFDCNGYPKAPPSFRIWAGGTVQTSDVELVLPWIDWAYSEIKSKHA